MTGTSRRSKRRRATNATGWPCIARASTPASRPVTRACESSSERQRARPRGSNTPVGEGRAVRLSSMRTPVTGDSLPGTSAERCVTDTSRACAAPAGHRWPAKTARAGVAGPSGRLKRRRRHRCARSPSDGSRTPWPNSHGPTRAGRTTAPASAPRWRLPRCVPSRRGDDGPLLEPQRRVTLTHDPPAEPIEAERRRRAGSVERAGGEHETRRNPRLRPAAAGVKARSVQAVPRRCLHRGLGFTAVGEDPRHDRLGVGTCRHDRGPFDHGAAGWMSSRQASEQRPYRLVVHAHHRSRSAQSSLSTGARPPAAHSRAAGSRPLCVWSTSAGA